MNKFKSTVWFIGTGITIFLLILLLLKVTGLISDEGRETPIWTTSRFIEGFFVHFVIALIIFGIPLLIIYNLKDLKSKIKAWIPITVFYLSFLVFFLFKGIGCWTYASACKYAYEDNFLSQILMFFKEGF